MILKYKGKKKSMYYSLQWYKLVLLIYIRFYNYVSALFLKKVLEIYTLVVLKMFILYIFYDILISLNKKLLKHNF